MSIQQFVSWCFEKSTAWHALAPLTAMRIMFHNEIKALRAENDEANMHSLIQGLAAFSTTCAERDEVALFLDKLCHSLLKDPKQFHRMLLHDLGGPMMLEAAQGSLPNASAVRVRAESSSILPSTPRDDPKRMRPARYTFNRASIRVSSQEVA